MLASGTIDAIERVSVGAQVSGQLKSLKVALGDRVQKGQLVAEIDDMTQQNELRNKQAALEMRRAARTAKVATLKQSELAYRRQRQMLAADASSRESFESAEATLAVTRAEIASLDAQIVQAEVDVDIAKVNLGYTRIVSPIDGVVVAVITKQADRQLHAERAHDHQGRQRGHHDHQGADIRSRRHPRQARPAGVLHHPGRAGRALSRHAARGGAGAGLDPEGRDDGVTDVRPAARPARRSTTACSTCPIPTSGCASP